MANRFLNNISINDQYTLPASDGNANQVLATNGSGQLSFVDQSGGASLSGGAANKLAIWSGTDALTNDTNLHWDTSNDRLGIGTANPNYALHVNGQIYSESSTYPVYYLKRNTSATGGSFNTTSGIASAFKLETDSSGTITDGFGGGIVFSLGDTSPNTAARIYARRDGGDQTGALQFWGGADGNAALMTMRASGNIGIGTTSPGAKLDVSGNIRLAQYGYIYFGSNSSNQLSLSNSLSGSQITQSGSGSLELQSASNDIHLKAGGLTKAVVRASGKVGIGTTNPGYKLEVNGTAKADKFVSLVNTSNSGITRDWAIIGTGDRGAGLQVNDISGAKYAIYAGGYDLTFGKHVSSNNTYTTALGIYAADATDSSPYVQATHSLRAPMFYDSGNSNYNWDPNTDLSHRFRTASGYLDIGPKNSSWCHLYTDRNGFYFNKTTFQLNGNQVFHDDYHPNADTLTTARTIAGTSFNGSANIDISYNNLTNKPTIPTNYLRDDAFDSGIGLYLQGGSFNAGTDTVTAPLVIDEEDFIYTKDGGYLRKLIGKTGDQIQIGQGGTSLITSINFLPGTAGNSAVKINSNTVWNAGNDGSGSGLDADLLDGQHAERFFRRTNKANATVGPGWMTVAENTSGRRAGEIVVTDGESGDHAYIRIEWMRSYNDSNFTVLNCGGHANRITGARVLYNTSNNTYGGKKLQVYVTTSSNYEVNIYEQGDIDDYTGHTVVTPVIQNSISGYALHGNELTGLDAYGFAAEEGILSGGDLKVLGTGNGIHVDSTGHASLRLDRGGTSYDNNLLFMTAGGIKWRLWQDGTDNQLMIRDDANSYNSVVFNAGGASGNTTFNTNVLIGLNQTPPSNAKLTVMGNQTFGIPGNGSNTSGRWLSFEGNADGSGEGSGRLFFSEHNSSTGAMDNYGMSIGYRGGSTSVTTAGGNTWTGLSAIGNGQWGMWGHDNSLAGTLIMAGPRSGNYVNISQSGGIRAQVFYDLNSTSYYVNPASSSKLYQLSMFGHSINSGQVMLVPDKTTYSSGAGFVNMTYRKLNVALSYTPETVVSFQAGTTQKGSIGMNAYGTQFNTSGSDERLKENFETWDENVLNSFETIQPKKFNFKSEPENSQKTKGYIAQEMVDKFPEAYPLMANENGEDRYMFNPSGMTVYLMKAVKELIEENKQLKQRVEVLENQ
jgi:hypothetical protein